ncbi:MAG: tyrosine-protein phosphatase [Rhodococcus sp. (in: high G+C Gram-positive bacteria)]
MSAPDAYRPDQFALSGAWNFRDVGGMRTVDGSRTRSGVLYRSSALTHLTDAGRADLTGFGVQHVFDLRSAAELQRDGSDRTPDSVSVHGVPYALPAADAVDPVRAAENAPHERQDRATSAREYMSESYRGFPTLPGARIAIASVIGTIASSGSSVLVHCAAGKDRAGWTVATVLRAAGVAEDDIVADYLRSNDAIEPLRRHILDHIDDAGDLDDDLLGVHEEYYRGGLESMHSTYGSFENYLDWLGIDSDTVAGLRRALIV